MLAWESFPGPRNNAYKNILGNALLPPKLFHIKLVNTRLIFSQVTQEGPLNSFVSWKIYSQIFPNFLEKKSSKGTKFLYRWSTFWPFLKGAECWPSGQIFGTCRQEIQGKSWQHLQRAAPCTDIDPCIHTWWPALYLGHKIRTLYRHLSKHLSKHLSSYIIDRSGGVPTLVNKRWHSQHGHCSKYNVPLKSNWYTFYLKHEYFIPSRIQH